MLNRTLAPKINQTELPNIQIADVNSLTSFNIALLSMKDEVCRVDLVFNCGILHQTEKDTANAVKDLLFSGTDTLDESHILSTLDKFGAYYGSEVSLNHFTVSLYSTPALINSVFSLFIEAVFNASFPVDKLQTYKSSRLASLLQNEEKTGYIAKKNASAQFYKTTNLSNPLKAEHISGLSQAELANFHKRIINSALNVYVAGAISNTQSFEHTIKPYRLRTQPQKNKIAPIFNDKFKKHFHQRKADAIQTSIRGLGQTIGKNNNDYSALLLSNMMFGGYFGSMIMQNIREEKGLTYGISSSLLSRSEYSIINISADIKKASIDGVINELGVELEHLRNGAFEDEFLSKTKSYLLGSIAKSCDDIFSNLDKTKSIHQHGLKPGFHSTLFNSLSNCTKDHVVQAANTYLHLDKICLSTCGDEQY